MRYGDGCMLVLRIVPLYGHVSVINDQHLDGSVVAGVAVPRVDHVTHNNLLAFLAETLWGLAFAHVMVRHDRRAFPGAHNLSGLLWEFL